MSDILNRRPWGGIVFLCVWLCGCAVDYLRGSVVARALGMVVRNKEVRHPWLGWCGWKASNELREAWPSTVFYL